MEKLQQSGAEELGITAIPVPELPGVLSAWGMHRSGLRMDTVRTLKRISPLLLKQNITAEQQLMAAIVIYVLLLKEEGIIMEAKEITIKYITNAGLLISAGKTKVLIDGIHSQKVPVFSTVPQEILAKMITGEGLFKDIAYLLFTHAHKDHFDPRQTLNYLANNRVKAVCISAEGYSLIENSRTNTGELNTSLIIMKQAYGKTELVFPDLKIKYFPIPHEGAEFKEVANYGFIISFGAATFLHLGDGSWRDSSIMESVLKDEQVDYAFLNFPFVNLPQGRLLIKNIIKPKKIFIIHLPNEEDDLYNYRAITAKALGRYREVLPEVKVLLDPLEVIKL
ncbi:MAG: MBL fold metallo-hydrolase [Peptococcaceae bacterium]